MATFPNIRAPLREGWSSPEKDGVRRTPMDSGPSKSRGDSSAVGQVEPYRFKLIASERDELRAFYAENKAVRFDIEEHWAWGVACEAKFDGPIVWSRGPGPWWFGDVRLEIFLPDEEEAP